MPLLGRELFENHFTNIFLHVEIAYNSMEKWVIKVTLFCRQEENLKKMSVKDIKMIQNVNLIKEINVKRLNLGVTTLIAYVSALTNDGCHHDFQSDILKKHAEWERARPVKPILDKLFSGNITLIFDCSNI